MPSGTRIVQSRNAGAAFTGFGAQLYGGRWNSPGIAVVYLSQHRSLAALEILVHTRPLTIRDTYHAFLAEWDDSIQETVRQPPRSWREEPPGPATMHIGDEWVRARRSAVLSVPSVIIPEEQNFVLNPAHPDYRKIVIRDQGEFRFDARLIDR